MFVLSCTAVQLRTNSSDRRLILVVEIFNTVSFLNVLPPIWQKPKFLIQSHQDGVTVQLLFLYRVRLVSILPSCSVSKKLTSVDTLKYCRFQQVRNHFSL